MNYDYDREVDILTIRLREQVRDGEIVDSEEFANGLVAEYGEDGNLVQIELRDISARIANSSGSRQTAKAA
ncbi:MAG TPA: DUF2283 domain-containing protein [Candidatus Kapabacteria bacterium]|jgi:uncharacterized protein YuzE|nr:DUF2283 domain-containing protein [Candidatus Kapabacteria bacterium]